VFIDFSYLWRSRGFASIGDNSLRNMLAEVFADTQNESGFLAIESERNRLLNSKQTIIVTDMGAGSRVFKSTMRNVARIASVSLSSTIECQRLFRLCSWAQCSQILELGTSLGISTAYLATAMPSSSVHSIEACPATLQLAHEVFENLKLQNIKTYNTVFDCAIEESKRVGTKFDLVYIDGDHNGGNTLSYVKQLHNGLLNEKHILVFDDITWSADMFRFWTDLVTNGTACYLRTRKRGYVFAGFGFKQQYIVLRK